MVYRNAEKPGWDSRHRRPRSFQVTVPGEDVRPVGSKHAVRVEVPWGSRQASVLVGLAHTEEHARQMDAVLRDASVRVSIDSSEARAGDASDL